MCISCACFSTKLAIKDYILKIVKLYTRWHNVHPGSRGKARKFIFSYLPRYLTSWVRLIQSSRFWNRAGGQGPAVNSCLSVSICLERDSYSKTAAIGTVAYE